MKFVKPDSPRGIAYYVLVAVVFVLLIVDFAGDGPQWGNAGVFAILAVALFVRPGGIFGQHG
jgi:branched-subunit amino acid ABC-type transport system permease component